MPSPNKVELIHLLLELLVSFSPYPLASIVRPIEMSFFTLNEGMFGLGMMNHSIHIWDDSLALPIEASQHRVFLSNNWHTCMNTAIICIFQPTHDISLNALKIDRRLHLIYFCASGFHCNWWHLLAWVLSWNFGMRRCYRATYHSRIWTKPFPCHFWSKELPLRVCIPSQQHGNFSFES
jgi:hypothetical protein